MSCVGKSEKSLRPGSPGMMATKKTPQKNPRGIHGSGDDLNWDVSLRRPRQWQKGRRDGTVGQTKERVGGNAAGSRVDSLSLKV